MQSQRAAEDGLVVADAPLAELGLDAGGWILDQQPGETLEADARRQSGLIAVGEFETLLDPASQIFSYVKEHPKLRVTPVQQGAVQVVAGGFALRQKALQLQIGARAFHQLAGSAGIGERMKDQGGQRPSDALRQSRRGSEG